MNHTDGPLVLAGPRSLPPWLWLLGGFILGLAVGFMAAISAYGPHGAP
jgi:uncharacterized protein involved in exopolysaccharide biosynthesis